MERVILCHEAGRRRISVPGTRVGEPQCPQRKEMEPELNQEGFCFRQLPLFLLRCGEEVVHRMDAEIPG